MSDTQQGQGWWQASDGKSYPPESHKRATLPPPAIFGGYGSAAPVPVQDDPWLGHFARFLGVYFLATVLNAVLLGFVWFVSILNQTGRRKRDLLLLFVPFVNAVVAVQSVWRYTARYVYWQPRDDRPSAVLAGTARTVAIVAGWIVAPLFFVFVIVGAIVAADQEAGWGDQDRIDFQEGIEGEGVDEATARCVTDHVAEQYPDGPETLPSDENELAAIGEEAFAACG